MKIPQSKIDEIKQAADIVELISGYVNLKLRGRNHVGLCPFHNEKTPSFTVSADKQIFYCFGCGVGGDAITFIKNYEKVTYPEAIRSLAEKYNIELPREGRDEAEDNRSEMEGLYYLHKAAARFYFDQLQSPAGQEARDYLQRRGFSERTLRAFGVGYAPDRWDALGEFAKSQSIDMALVEKAGLVIRRKEGGHYDRFRHRIMFPIFNASGRIMAFGGRQLRDEPNAPKYLNSPENPIYQKGRTLYGISHAKDAIRKEDGILIVEGYADCITLHQYGFTNATASSGTAFTFDQANLIRRFTANVTLIYDGDEAGLRAAERGGAIMLQAGLGVRIVALPPSHDPDSYVRNEGADAFRRILHEAWQYIDFRIQQWQRNRKLETVNQRASAARELIAVVRQIRDPIKSSAYATEIAEKLHLDENVLRLELQKTSRETPPDTAPRAVAPMTSPSSKPKPELPPKVVEAERGVLRALLEAEPAQTQYIFVHLRPEDFQHDVMHRIVAFVFDQFRLQEPLSADSISRAFEEDIRRAIARLMIEDRYLYDLDDCIAVIQSRQLELRLESLREMILHSQRQGEDTTPWDETAAQIMKQLHGVRSRKQLLKAGDRSGKDVV